jgi:hypothetical protein
MSKFDDKIKEKLYNYESEVPDHIWNSVKKEIQPDRKSYFLLWFFSFLFLFLGLSFYFTFDRAKRNTTLANSQSQMNTSNSELSSPLTSDADLKSTKNDNVATSSNATSTEGVNFPSEDNKGSFASNKQSISELESFVKNNNRHSERSDISSKNKNELSSFDKIDSSPTELTSNEIQSGSNDHAFTGERKSADNQIGNQNEENKLDQNHVAYPVFLSSHQRLVLGMDQSDKFEEIFKSMKKHVSFACPTFVKKQNLTFVEVYLSNVYAHKSLTQNRGEDETYLNLRKQTENSHLSFAFGTRLGIGWENGIAFKSGVDVTQINEKFEYVDPRSIQKKVITVVKYIYDTQYNIIDSVKTIEEIEIPGTNKIINKNSYTFIDMPILFQYTLSGTRRLSYSVSVGTYINIALANSGKILDEKSNNNKIRSIVKLEETNYLKNNIGLSFFGAVGINYQLTNNIQIVFEPSVRFLPSPISKTTYSLNQNYLFTNISAGLKYKI